MAINLIPQEDAVVSQENAIKRGIFFGIIVVILSFSGLGLRYYFDSRTLDDLNIREESIKEKEEDLQKYKDSVVKYKNHPALQVLSNHTYHTEFLSVFEECVLPNMYISSIKIDANNKVSISATINGKYADAARFIKTLREKELPNSTSNPKLKVFSNIKVGGLTRGDDGRVNFNLDFDFNKALILRQ